MNIDREHIRLLTGMQGITVPDSELDSIAIRLTTWLSALEEIEKEIGPQINAAEPIPPVYPREEF